MIKGTETAKWYGGGWCPFWFRAQNVTPLQKEEKSTNYNNYNSNEDPQGEYLNLAINQERQKESGKHSSTNKWLYDANWAVN